MGSDGIFPTNETGRGRPLAYGVMHQMFDMIGHLDDGFFESEDLCIRAIELRRIEQVERVSLELGVARYKVTFEAWSHCRR